jgi:hypothetical protein
MTDGVDLSIFAVARLRRGYAAGSSAGQPPARVIAARAWAGGRGSTRPHDHGTRPNRREEFVGITKSRHALRRRGHGRTRWYHVFAATDMAISATHADAWAFDAELGKAFKLAGTHVVR